MNLRQQKKQWYSLLKITALDCNFNNENNKKFNNKNINIHLGSAPKNTTIQMIISLWLDVTLFD